MKEETSEIKSEAIKIEVDRDYAHANNSKECDEPELATPSTENAPIDSDIKKCPACSKIFHTKGDLKRHARTHTGERPYQCSQCARRFAQQYNLKVHCRTHTGERPYGCTICGKNFRSSSDLRRHNRVHTGEKPFTCTTCGNSFSQSSTLRLHASTHALKTVASFWFVDCGCDENVDIKRE